MNAPMSLLAEYSTNAVTAWNALVTSVYKLVGFAMLTLILIGLVSYFGLHVFYLVSDTWVAPVILSAHHERVLQLNTHAVQQANQRDLLTAERLAVVDTLQGAEQSIELERAFQASFGEAVAEELAARQEFLAEAAPLERKHRESQESVARANDAFVGVTEAELERQYAAGLIDRSSYVQARRGLTSIAQSELALRDRAVQLSSAIRDSQREIAAMRGTLGAAGSAVPGDMNATSYPALLMQRAYQQSLLDVVQLERERGSARRRLALIDASIARHDRLLAEIDASPYRRALGERITLAFVPYEHLDRVAERKALYGCRAGLLWCRRVGEVVSILDGEVTVKHPLSNELVRGLMIEIDLEQGRWAEEKALYLGKAPLFI